MTVRRRALRRVPNVRQCFFLLVCSVVLINVTLFKRDNWKQVQSPTKERELITDEIVNGTGDRREVGVSRDPSLKEYELGSTPFIRLIKKQRVSDTSQTKPETVWTDPEGVESTMKSEPPARSPIRRSNKTTAGTIRGSVQYKMSIGISVAVRKPPTIYRLLDEILRPENDLKDIVFVIHLSYGAYQDKELLTGLYHRQKDNIHVHVVVEKAPYTEADQKNIPSTKLNGDTMERTVWRTKQVMDYAMLMKALLKFNATYILVLEDDVKPAKNAFAKAVKIAEGLNNLGLLALYSGYRRMWKGGTKQLRGAVAAPAWLYGRASAERVADMLLSKPWGGPVDLQIPPYIVAILNMNIYESNPHLFQHVSERSTYVGKDANRRKAETWRSPSFEYDEDNNTAALTPSGPDGYIGCFQDHSQPRERDLACQFDLSPSNGNMDKCRKFCANSYYFGLQMGRQCFCGNEFGRYRQISDTKCNHPCHAQHSQMCGGVLVNSVYRVKPYKATFKGCYKVAILSLKKILILLSKVSAHTVDSCADSCGVKSIFGLAEGNTCYCFKAGVFTDVVNTTLERFKMDNGECNVRCHGYHGQVCGGTGGSIAVYISTG